MTEWYRNREWTDETAAEFERRLERSRSGKAQYLSLQGYHLIATHPDVARDLLNRAIAIEDPLETPRAANYLATALLALGDVDAALDAYEYALGCQASQPKVIAVQPADYLLVVGAFSRRDRLPAAVPIADALPDESPWGPDAQTVAAKSLVYALAGRSAEAQRYARRALPLFDEIPDAKALGIDTGAIRARLAALT